MRVVLTKVEIHIANHVTNKRQDYNKDIGRKATPYIRGWYFMSKEEKEIALFDMCLNSYGAEIAVCRAFNAYLDMNTKTPMPYDLKNRAMETIDVKWSREEDAVMHIKKTRGKIYPDFFVFVVGTFPRFRICGYISKRDAMVENYYRDDAKHKCWAIPQDALRHFGEIV